MEMKPEKGSRGRGRGGRGRGRGGNGGGRGASAKETKDNKRSKKPKGEEGGNDAGGEEWSGQQWYWEGEEAWAAEDYGSSGYYWDQYVQADGNESLKKLKGDHEEPKKKKTNPRIPRQRRMKRRQIRQRPRDLDKKGASKTLHLQALQQTRRRKERVAPMCMRQLTSPAGAVNKQQQL